MKQKVIAGLAVLTAGIILLSRLFIKEPKTSSDFPQKKREKSQSELDKI